MHGCIGPANIEAMQKAVDKKIAQYPKVRTCLLLEVGREHGTNQLTA